MSNKLRILCVDDDLAYRRYLTYLLGKRYCIVFVSSGNECVDVTKNEIFDLVFVDSALPDMASDAVCEILRDDPFYQDTPIIILSHQYSLNEVKRLDSCGADDYFSKMSSPNELSALLDIALEMAA
ncbi:hypothetical protein A9Q81_06305 [Gammaproteobacteria bacterium 42_54_T18]|nr:hypothetical protein A9Q81_06305 [Gammaproteobacteria bacterium 42_54_T18]